MNNHSRIDYREIHDTIKSFFMDRINACHSNIENDMMVLSYSLGSTIVPLSRNLAADKDCFVDELVFVIMDILRKLIRDRNNDCLSSLCGTCVFNLYCENYRNVGEKNDSKIDSDK